MASKTVLRAVFIAEPWRPLPRKTAPFSAPFFLTQNLSPPHLRCSCKLIKARRYYTFPRRTQPLNCSNNETPSSSPEDFEQNPPQEAVLKAISEVSKTEGRVGQTTNMVIGGTTHDDSTNEWLALDKKTLLGAEKLWCYYLYHKLVVDCFFFGVGNHVVGGIKVNSYPTERGFTAIGIGGDDFVQAMVVAVESVIQQPIPQGQVRQKVSSGGKYVSVNIGPIHVVSSEQVQAVYNAMRRDDRMKYFL
nr:uncharacterized protein LOC109193431 [Ipomoea batatas]